GGMGAAGRARHAGGQRRARRRRLCAPGAPFCGRRRWRRGVRPLVHRAAAAGAAGHRRKGTVAGRGARRPAMTRATPHPFTPRCILITGATGSIGGALAAEYAAPGTTLILQGRNRARLQEVAAQCSGKGARVLLEDFDIRDHERLLAWLHGISEAEPVDLAIVNAGVNISTGADGEGEAWDEVLALIDVNIRAALATVHGVLPGMRRRGGGQIALISSLAAWRGLPETPSYSASKAALKV